MKNLEQLHAEAPILKRTIDLYREFYQYLKTFPKKDQYMLGKRCEEYILAFLELILFAVGLDKVRKLKVLEDANAKFDALKILFRLSRELKMLDDKKYLSLEAIAQDIGRQLGGWIRSQ